MQLTYTHLSNLQEFLRVSEFIKVTDTFSHVHCPHRANHGRAIGRQLTAQFGVWYRLVRFNNQAKKKWKSYQLQ